MKVRLQNELKPKSAITAIQILRGRKKFKKTSKNLGDLVQASSNREPETNLHFRTRDNNLKIPNQNLLA